MSGELKNGSIHVVRVSHKTCWTFVRLQTEDGRTGEGEATLLAREDELVSAGEALIPVALREAEISDPGSFARQHVPASLPRAGIVSAIDQALWSLKVSGNGQSLAEALGVRREPVPVYANINRRTEERTPKGFAASAKAAMAAGHVAFKVAPFDEVDTALCSRGEGVAAMQAGLERVAAVRDAVGSDSRLMIDCHWRFDEDTAVELIKAAAEMAVYWVETPLLEIEENIPALTRLRRQCNDLGMRLAGLETSVTWQGFRPFCEAGAYDVVMPDVKYIGGVDELLRTVDHCDALGMEISPHNPSGPICHAMSLQVSAALGAFDRLELQFDESPLFDALAGSRQVEVSSGLLSLPAGPGLGVTLDTAVLLQHEDRPASEFNV